MDPAEPQYASPPAGSGWAPPPSGPTPSTRRIRAGIVVLVAVVTELVLIGAGANQWVSERIVRNSFKHGLSVQLIEGSWLTYTWRWDPTDGRIWWAHVLLIVTLAVVSGLLIWCVVRGPVSFARAFFGTWMAVIVATLLGAFVRGLVEPNSNLLPGTNAVTRAIFGPAGPNSEVVFGSFVLGLVVGLIAGLLAVTTARPASAGPAPYEPAAFADYGPPPAAAAGGPLPPWQDQHYGPPARPLTPPPAASHRPDERTTGEDAQTTQLPSFDKNAEHQPTTRLPAPEAPQAPPGDAPQAPQAQQAPRGDAPDQATTRFPRPPDDEALGHVED